MDSRNRSDHCREMVAVGFPEAQHLYDAAVPGTAFRPSRQKRHGDVLAGCNKTSISTAPTFVSF